MLTDIQNAINKIRETKPLILNLTNFVTMDFVANCLLAVGAAPIMSIEPSEYEELIVMSSSVYINIGTLNNNFVNQVDLVIELAKKYNKPIIFDPVGSGATLLRTKAAQNFASFADIVRGNASEVISLADNKAKTHGVESYNSVNEAKEIATNYAETYNNVIVISGAKDIITSSNKVTELKFGSSIMPLVTGMGCSLTSIIAAFRAVIHDSYEASVLAAAYFGLCGNLAESKSDKPGSFRTYFIDELYKADFKSMKRFYEI